MCIMHANKIPAVPIKITAHPLPTVQGTSPPRHHAGVPPPIMRHMNLEDRLHIRGGTHDVQTFTLGQDATGIAAFE